MDSMTTIPRPTALVASASPDAARFTPDPEPGDPGTACSRACGQCWITWVGTDDDGAWLCETTRAARELEGASQ